MGPETPSDEQLEGSVWAPACDPPVGGPAGALPWDKPATGRTGSVRRERSPMSGTRAGTPCAGACREPAAGCGPSALGAALLSSHRRGGSRSLGRCGCPGHPADPRLSPDSRWVDPSSRCCPWTRRHSQKGRRQFHRCQIYTGRREGAWCFRQQLRTTPPVHTPAARLCDHRERSGSR